MYLTNSNHTYIYINMQVHVHMICTIISTGAGDSNEPSTVWRLDVIPLLRPCCFCFKRRRSQAFETKQGKGRMSATEKKGAPKNQVGLVWSLRWPESSSEPFFVGSAHNLSIKPWDLIFFAWLGANHWSGGDIERWWGWQYVKFVNDRMSRV